MCGRYTLTHPEEALAEALGGDAPAPPLSARFNIAPSQEVAAIRRHPGSKRQLAFLSWGLPSTGKARRINSRAETFVAERRSPLRRCLILADGFYEWERCPGGRQPHYFRRVNGRPFAFAGVWAESRRAGCAPDLCAILTTRANAKVERIHNRMPVILGAGGYGPWLDPALSGDQLEPLLAPFPAEEMECHPVGLGVNRVDREGPSCIEPAPPLPRNLSLFDEPT